MARTEYEWMRPVDAPDIMDEKRAMMRDMEVFYLRILSVLPIIHSDS
jgi:hypothetical protein